jgi:LacI family transcriptional regulator
VPTAVVDITTRVAGADVIAIDPVETGLLGARHLLSRGHRRLAVVAPVGDTRTPGEVVSGIEQAASDAGASLVKIEIDRREPRPEPAWSRAREAVVTALSRSTDVTAIIGVGPQLTLGACMGVRASGRSIPGDVSVVGLLGDSSALQAFDPPVTIYDNPLQSVCEKAARRLLGRIQGLDEPPRAFPRSPVLVDRASAAGPRAGS